MRTGSVTCEQLAGYADVREKAARASVFGEGFVGQCAVDSAQRLLLTACRPADAIQSAPACSIAQPRNVMVLPVLYEGRDQGRHRAGLAA